jgi:S1-C subfamily serine protease
LPDAPYSQQGAFEPGDVIHAINGNLINGIADLKAALSALKPDSAVVLQLERDGMLMYLAFRLNR